MGEGVPRASAALTHEHVFTMVARAKRQILADRQTAKKKRKRRMQAASRKRNR